jgi:hypothetical protein
MMMMMMMMMLCDVPICSQGAGAAAALADYMVC